MRKTIRLLEDRVSTAVERLERLASERDRLQQELQITQDRLETVEQAGPPPSLNVEGDPFDRDEVVEALRQALAELREDEPQ